MPELTPAPRARVQSQTSTTTTRSDGPWWHAVLWGIAGGVGGFWGGAFAGDGISRLVAIGSGNEPNFLYVVVGSIAGAFAGAVVLANIGP